MGTTKIYILDGHGKRLGRDYDYEYGGRRREAGRATHVRRLRMWCLGAIAVLLALGLWPVMGALLGAYIYKNGMTGPFLILGVCVFFAAVLYFSLRLSLKMRNELYAVLDAASCGRRQEK